MFRSRISSPAVHIAAALLIGLPPFAASAQEQAPTPTVTVIKAEPTDYTQSAWLPGRIKASTVSEVRPQVSGIIRARNFDEGTEVKEGQPLYEIESDTYAAMVKAAQAGVAQAQANYDLSVREAERAEELFANKTGSGQRRDSAIATRDAANAALQLSQAQLQSAEIDLERTTIRAPIGGVIGFSQTTPGTLVAAQQVNPLTTIRALDPIYVDVTQSANDLLRWRQAEQRGGVMATGQATLMMPTGDTYPIKGELRAAEPQVAPTTGMITLRISFPNPDHLLLPGMYVEVVLPQIEEKGVYLVPQSAVMRDPQGTAHAWVVENGTVAVRTLSILTSDAGNWVVTDGLKPGDEIITTGFQKIAPGGPVAIAPGDVPATTATAAAAESAVDAAESAAAAADAAAKASSPDAAAPAEAPADAATEAPADAPAEVAPAAAPEGN